MFIADIILVIHFCIVIFITSGFLLIPIGYKINWALPKNRRLRMLHLGLMMFVTLETILGVTCPLTSIENELRGILETETFIRHWIKKIIYWNFPTHFFISLYCFFLGWTFLMWKFFPPQVSKNNSK